VFDFILAAYRAVADEDADVIAAEVRHLDAALAEMALSHPGEKDLIVAGQLHLEAAELALLTAATVRTGGAGAALNLLGEPAPVLRDHVLVRDPRTSAQTSEGSAIDVRDAVGSPLLFRDTVSDHLPVALRLRVGGRDDD
jgi:hypothetical protein